MKAKRILLLTMSVLAITTLGSCRGGRRGRGSTSGADVTSNTGGGQTVIPGGSSQSGGSSQGGTSQGGGTSQSGSYTAQSIANALGSIFSAEVYDCSDQGYVGCYALYDLHSEIAQGQNQACFEATVAKFPSYLVELQAPAAGTYNDGTAYYGGYYGLADESILVEVSAYYDDEYDNCMNTELFVGPASAFESE